MVVKVPRREALTISPYPRRGALDRRQPRIAAAALREKVMGIVTELEY
jgi:hypothetical protein